MDKSLKAFASYESVKKSKKMLEKRAIKYVKMNEKLAIVTANVAISLTKKEISTRSIKKLRLDFAGGVLSPEAVYHTDDKNIETKLNVKWEF